jgi:hypothetical protein
MPTPKSTPEFQAHHVVGGAGHHGALHHHHMEGRLVAQHAADLARHLAHVAEIDALAVEGRADGDEGDLGVEHRGPQVGGGAQALADVALEQILQAVLVDRRLAAVDAVDLALVDVDAQAVVADLGEAGAGDDADIAGADDGDLHQASSASWLWWYHSSVRRRPSSMPMPGS